MELVAPNGEIHGIPFLPSTKAWKVAFTTFVVGLSMVTMAIGKGDVLAVAMYEALMTTWVAGYRPAEASGGYGFIDGFTDGKGLEF